MAKRTTNSMIAESTRMKNNCWLKYFQSKTSIIIITYDSNFVFWHTSNGAARRRKSCPSTKFIGMPAASIAPKQFGIVVCGRSNVIPSKSVNNYRNYWLSKSSPANRENIVFSWSCYWYAFDYSAVIVTACSTQHNICGIVSNTVSVFRWMLQKCHARFLLLMLINTSRRIIHASIKITG